MINNVKKRNKKYLEKPKEEIKIGTSYIFEKSSIQEFDWNESSKFIKSIAKYFVNSSQDKLAQWNKYIHKTSVDFSEDLQILAEHNFGSL